MAISNSIEVKIRALVQGLEDVTKMGRSLRDMAKEADGAGASGARGSAGLKGLGAQAGVADREARRAAAGVGNLKDQLAQIQGATNAASKALGGLVSVFKLAAGGFVGFSLVSQVKQFADAAARAETLAVTLGVVGQNAGYTQQQLTGYETEIRKMGISTEAARDSLTKLIQAGIELSTVNSQGQSTAAALARASQDLAVITGKNSSETFQRLITNIQQLDSMGLRYQGLLVNIQGAQDKFAATIGKTADSLTQQQKQQAVLNEVLVQASALTGAYERSLETVGKKLGSLERVASDASVAIGTTLTPAYGVLVDAATDFLKSITAMATEFNNTSTLAADFAMGLREVVAIMGDMIGAAVKFVRSLDWTPVLTGLKLLGNSVIAAWNTTKQLFDTIMKIGSSGNLLEGLQFAVFTIGLFLAGLADGFRLAQSIALLFFGAIAKGLGESIRGWGMLIGLVNEEWGAAVEKAGEEMVQIADASRDSAYSIINDFANGKSAVQEFLDPLKAAKAELESLGVTDLKQAEESLRKFSEQLRLGKTSSRENEQEFQRLVKVLELLKSTGKITADEFKGLDTKLQTMGAKGEEAFLKILEQLGLTKDQLTNGVTPAAKAASASMLELAENGRTTADQFDRAFEVKLETAKALEDLEGFKKALEAAKKQGVNTDQIKSQLDDLGRKFEEIFLTKLNTAKTDAQFKELAASVRRVGEQGVISGDRMKLALEQISQVSSKASEDIKVASDQSKASSDQRVAVAKAETKHHAATLSVLEDRKKVEAAMALASKDNNAKNRAALTLARAELQLKVELEKQAKIELELQRQIQREMLIQQRLANAERQLEKDPTNEKNIKAVAALKQQLQTQSLITDQIRLQGDEQELVVQKQIQQKDAAATQVRLVEGTVDALGRSAEEMGKLADEAERYQKAMAAARNNFSQAGSDLNQLFTDQKNKIAALSEGASKAYGEALGLGSGLVTASEGADSLSGKLAAAEANVRAFRDVSTQTILTLNPFQSAMANIAISGARIEADFYRTKIAMEGFQKKLADAGDDYHKLMNVLTQPKPNLDLLPKAEADAFKASIEDAKKRVTELDAQRKAEAAASKFAREQDAAARGKALTEEQKRMTDAEYAKATAAEAAAAQIVAAQQKITDAAKQATDQAISAAQKFASSISGIMTELNQIRIQQATNRGDLSTAQALEEEAATKRMNTREQELALEYQLLRVKLASAAAQAKAAGLTSEAAEIEAAMKDASSGFEQAQVALKELRSAQKQEIGSKYQGLREQQQANKAREQQQRTAQEAGAVRRVSEVGAPVQSIARERAGAVAREQTPEKTVRVLLENAGKQVPALIRAQDEAGLLTVLEGLRKRS